MRITHKKCDRVKDGKGFDIQSLHIQNLIPTSYEITFT